MKLELYYYEQCPFCRMVLNKISNLNLDSKVSYKNTLENPELRELHIKQTGRATVPCLYIDDKPLFESSSICEWLEQNKSTL